MAEIKCIDVSEWQGNIDFGKVKKSGIDCVVLRAGFGRESSQVDAEFEKYYNSAKSAGLKIGVYWYSYAVDVADARSEARACLEVIKGKKFELPVFYDMEENFQTSFGKVNLTKMAKAFMNEIIKGGYRAGVYANANWFQNFLDFDELYGTYYIWLAQYYNEPQFKCDMWQYTSSGEVSGIKGNVDLNVIYSDKLVKSVDKAAENLETGAIQALLMICQKQGIIKSTISPLDNKKGKLTKAAIKEMKKVLELKTDDSVNLNFIRKVYDKIVMNLEAAGDINGDGKVNIRDVTALQKRIAGDGDV